MSKITILVHAVLVLLSYTSWLWLDWRIVAVIAALHLSMLEVLNGCPLSHMQFPEDRDKRFYEWWMGLMGVSLSGQRRKNVRIFMQYILPGLIVLLAILMQVILGLRPILAL